MGKSKQHTGELTMALWAGMLGAIVDTMLATDAPPGVIHDFLDSVERQSIAMLRGSARKFVTELIYVVRLAVPVND